MHPFKPVIIYIPKATLSRNLVPSQFHRYFSPFVKNPAGATSHNMQLSTQLHPVQQQQVQFGVSLQPFMLSPVRENSCRSSRSLSFLPTTLHCPLTRVWFWSSFQLWTSICQRVKPPLIVGKHRHAPVLQLQLRSAGSFHVAFRNLHESESRPGGCRTSEVKQEHIFSIKYEPVSPKLLFCATW